MHQVAAFTSLCMVDLQATYSAVPHPSNVYGGNTTLGAQQNHLILLPSLHGREGSSFPVCVNLMMQWTQSVLGVKPGDSGVVIGYQVDELSDICLGEHFIACPNIYPGFTGKVSTLVHFPLETGCADYSFLDQAGEDIEHGLDSICMVSVNTELDASFDEADAIPSSVFRVSTLSIISHNSRLQLASSIKSDKLWCQTRALLYLYQRQVKCEPLTLIHYFSSHPAAFEC